MLLMRIAALLALVLVAVAAPSPAAAERPDYMARDYKNANPGYEPRPEVLPARPDRRGGPQILPHDQRPLTDAQIRRQERIQERQREREMRRSNRLNQNDEMGMPGNVQVLEHNRGSSHVSVDNAGNVTQQPVPVDPQQAREEAEMNARLLQAQQAQTQELRRLRQSVDRLPERAHGQGTQKYKKFE